MDIESLTRHLSSDIDARIKQSTKTNSAVLVIIYNSSKPKVLMMVKSKSMRHHAGEVAFPGGKFEEQDFDLLETALRESYEEIGINFKRDTIVGQLRSVDTQSSGYLITPFVYITNKLKKITTNAEVDKLLCIPLEELFGSKNYLTKRDITFSYDGHDIWGASARILEELAQKTGLL